MVVLIAIIVTIVLVVIIAQIVMVVLIVQVVKLVIRNVIQTISYLFIGVNIIFKTSI